MATRVHQARLLSLENPQRVAVVATSRLLDLYHALMAPFFAAHCGFSCRFEPSCSRYAKTALLGHGLWRGGYMTMRRLMRCHPWGGSGYDPVPGKFDSH